MGSGQGLTNEILRTSFTNSLTQWRDAASAANFEQIANSNEFDDTIKEMNKFIVSKGIQTFPVAFVNGVPVEVSSPEQVKYILIKLEI
jgi:predicted lipoprotein